MTLKLSDFQFVLINYAFCNFKCKFAHESFFFEDLLKKIDKNIFF